MKRFWSQAERAPAVDGFTILLDGKILRLPSGNSLTVPFSTLADAIAVEWGQAGGAAQHFTPNDLPLTRLASTAQDRVRRYRDDIIVQLANYGMNDLLCYREDRQPGLGEREDVAWQPWLDWAAQKYGVRFLLARGIIPIAQPAENLILFKAALANMTEYQLAGLGVIVPALGSLVLGLAVQTGELGPAAAADLAQVSALWQEERWGKDDEATARRKMILEDVAAAARFMVLCAA